ncbi:MAG TPA: ribonuclease HI family protein [Myxococcaceae bacterium]|nr:ribonuclease HI family protein [Myxococcaceae bacterium]
MVTPTDAELLRHIARQEGLEHTLRAFPGVNRSRLAEALERAASAAEALESRKRTPASAAPKTAAPPERPSPAPKHSAVDAAEEVRIYSDGAARGNPGPAGAGAVITDPTGKVLERLGKYLGRQTNNHAEYMGLIIGLERARELGVRRVQIFADSELMIRQLQGRYQVKSATLKPLYDRARKLIAAFEKATLTHVLRAQNAEADEMSNRAIDERM